MKFSICIPTSRPTTLAAAIDSICRQTLSDWELIVIGQGIDTDIRAVVEVAMQNDARVKYIHLNQKGAARARNAGMRASQGDFIAMIDDDCEAREDWLEVMADYFDNDSTVGLVSGSLIAPASAKRGFAVCPHLEPSESVYDPSANFGKPPQGWWWMGANLAIRRNVLSTVGFFDDYLGPGTSFPGAEDTDYMWRLEALGVKMISTPRSVVYHTSGYRYGLQAVFRQQRAYACANGGLAAKLTLLGDPRGREWIQRDIRTLGMGRWSLRLYRLPLNLLRLWYFVGAYRHGLQEYRADRDRCMLYPVSAIVQDT